VKKEGTNMKSGGRLIWGYLVHLSFNMWGDRVARHSYNPVNPVLRFNRRLWVEILGRLRDMGANMVVIDLGDGVKYASHPEIAVKGAWSRSLLGDELDRARSMGIEPIPKMNFSACHDAWLGPYSRRVSTPEYYRVCRDLIAEASRLFGKPRFFHLGMDEETASHQRNFRYVVIRQHDLWWHDFMFLCREVHRHGVRPWVWADYCWHHAKEYWKVVPRWVLQSNWYYAWSFSEKLRYVEAYRDLDRKGYDQVPAATYYKADFAHYESFPRTVKYIPPRISRKRLKGFLQTVWVPTTTEFRSNHMGALDRMEKGIRIWRRKHGS
jgi:hypothetical protein